MAKLNPVFSGIRVEEGINTAASVQGVAGKTLFLLGIAVLSAVLSMTTGASVIAANPSILFIAMIGALICGIAGQVSARAAQVCSIIYAVCEGILLGLISFAFDAVFGGIVMSAILITVTIFGVMLLLYSSNIIRVTGRFMRIMSGIGLTLCIVSFVYLISFWINPYNILVTALAQNTGLVVLISVLVLIYGAFMLAMDFEQVKMIVANGFDKRYEWMAALGLMVTLIWIYIEVLRLLAILASNRD